MHADMPEVLLSLQEQSRSSSEYALQLKLQFDAERKRYVRQALELRQAVTSLRWWAVAGLLWMLREALEPARFAHSYPSSWAYKLAVMTAHPQFLVWWFSVSAALIAPAVIFMAAAPMHRYCSRTQDLAIFGLGGGAFGYAYLATAAMRLDAPHVVDSYVGSSVMLFVTALLVACWHNSRVVREFLHRQEGAACADQAR